VGKYGTAGQATDDSIIRRMRFACRITKAADTHSEYVTYFAFPRQQCLRERASMLRYTYIACLVREFLFWRHRCSENSKTRMFPFAAYLQNLIFTNKNTYSA
jgi:hypothetical protein